MNIVIIVDWTYRKALQTAKDKHVTGEWYWVSRHWIAFDWIDRCRERGVDIDPTFVY